MVAVASIMQSACDLTYHVVHLDVAIREGNGIRGCGHRYHKGKGGRDSGWYHQVERVDTEVGSLQYMYIHVM